VQPRGEVRLGVDMSPGGGVPARPEVPGWGRVFVMSADVVRACGGLRRRRVVALRLQHRITHLAGRERYARRVTSSRLPPGRTRASRAPPASASARGPEERVAAALRSPALPGGANDWLLIARRNTPIMLR